MVLLPPLVQYNKGSCVREVLKCGWFGLTSFSSWTLKLRKVPKPVICSTVNRQIMVLGVSVSRERKVCSYDYHLDEAGDVIGLQIPVCKMEHLGYGLKCC